MTSSATQKVCDNGNTCNQAAVANCRCCSKAFCIKHMNDHRRVLDEQIKPIIKTCDSLRKTLSQQSAKPQSHTLIKEIDNWEKESIAKIKQRANDLRELLKQPVNNHTKDLLEKLQNLSDQLKKSREDNNFSETDLNDWKQRLDDFKANLTSPSIISIDRRENGSLLETISVNEFTVATDLFERVSDNNVRIEDDRKKAVRDSSDHCTEIRGKNEYKSGCHKISLRIEELSSLWTFLGINAKSTPLQNASYNSKSTYGWSNDNCIWSNGQHKCSRSKSHIAMKKGDVINLLLDCDKCTITMINERTIAKYESPVDVLHCPLPWQLHVILCEPNSCVRLLSADTHAD